MTAEEATATLNLQGGYVQDTMFTTGNCPTEQQLSGFKC